MKRFFFSVGLALFLGQSFEGSAGETPAVKVSSREQKTKGKEKKSGTPLKNPKLVGGKGVRVMVQKTRTLF